MPAREVSLKIVLNIMLYTITVMMRKMLLVTTMKMLIRMLAM